jgi:hypothetical protein
MRTVKCFALSATALLIPGQVIAQTAANAKVSATNLSEPSEKIAKSVLSGMASYGSPIQGGTVTVINGDGQVVAKKFYATNADGMFQINLPGEVMEDLAVIVEGGLVNGKLFTGRVSTVISAGFNLNSDFALPNPISHMVLQYIMRNPGVTTEQAEVRVRQYLDLSLRIPLNRQVGSNFDLGSFNRMAAQMGGPERLTQSLVTEMSRNDSAVRAFHGPQLLKGFGFEDIMKKLAEAMAEQVAIGIFDSVRDGSPYQTDTQKIFQLLKLIDQRLAQIDKKLIEIESQIKKADYNSRAQKIWTDYTALVGIAEKVDLWNKKIAASGATPAVKAEAAKEVEKLRLEVIEKVGPFINLVYSNFVTSKDIDPVQQVFAEYLVLKNPVADQTYINNLDQQVQMYKSFQVAALGLLTEALKSEPTKREIEYETAVEKMKKQVVKYPANIKLFENADRIKEIRDGNTIFDTLTFRIWDTHYTRYERCLSIKDYRKNMKAGNSNIAYRDQIRELAGHASRPGNWSEITKSLGWKDADQKKMVVFNCEVVEAEPYRHSESYDTIHWFGDDRSGPWDEYYDHFWQYRNIRDGKGMQPGLWVMTFRDYGNK